MEFFLNQFGNVGMFFLFIFFSVVNVWLGSTLGFFRIFGLQRVGQCRIGDN